MDFQLYMPEYNLAECGKGKKKSMETIIIVAVSALNIVCFLIGATVGFRVQKGEPPVEAPKNPVKAVMEREDKRHAKEEQERLDTILRNIERYDGTERGQEDVRG